MMERIDYEKMARLLNSPHGWQYTANRLRDIATAAAEAQREAIEAPIVDDIIATSERAANATSEEARQSYECQRSTMLRALAAVRATKLITESEAVDA